MIVNSGLFRNLLIKLFSLLKIVIVIVTVIV